MNMGERIKQLRIANGLTQEKLGKYLGVQKSAIRKYEKGSVTNIKRTSIETMSKLFNVSPSYLMCIEDSDLVEEHDYNNEIKQIPLLGKIAAGYPTTMFADVIDYIDIPADMARGNKELFALKTKGKSMEPNFIEGDILIFEKTEDWENGQFCAVAVNGDDATFKKVTKTDTGIMLQPLNPAFETKFYTNDQIASLPVQIIGVLKQIRRNF